MHRIAHKRNEGIHWRLLKKQKLVKEKNVDQECEEQSGLDIGMPCPIHAIAEKKDKQ
jgi:hypothetical protein